MLAKPAIEMRHLNVKQAACPWPAGVARLMERV
jgi:hypothetical protein